MDTSKYKRNVTFAMTEHEHYLMERIERHHVKKIDILRRGILFMCDKLNIPTASNPPHVADGIQE